MEGCALITKGLCHHVFISTLLTAIVDAFSSRPSFNVGNVDSNAPGFLPERPTLLSDLRHLLPARTFARALLKKLGTGTVENTDEEACTYGQTRGSLFLLSCSSNASRSILISPGSRRLRRETVTLRVTVMLGQPSPRTLLPYWSVHHSGPTNSSVSCGSGTVFSLGGLRVQSCQRNDDASVEYLVCSHADTWRRISRIQFIYRIVHQSEQRCYRQPRECLSLNVDVDYVQPLVLVRISDPIRMAKRKLARPC